MDLGHFASDYSLSLRIVVAIRGRRSKLRFRSPNFHFLSFCACTRPVTFIAFPVQGATAITGSKHRYWMSKAIDVSKGHSDLEIIEHCPMADADLEKLLDWIVSNPKLAGWFPRMAADRDNLACKLNPPS